MKRTIEATGKKVDDAINEALRVLGVSISDDDVEVKIISHGGFLKKAKVEVSVGKDDLVKAVVKAEVKPAPAKAEVKAEVKPAPVKAEAKAEVKPAPAKTEVKAEVKPAPANKPFNRNENNDKSAQKRPEQHQRPDNGFKKDKKHEDRPIVSAPVNKEHTDKCEAFLDGLLKLVGIDGKAVLTVDNGINAVIDTQDSAIIGYRGEVLDAFQYLTSLILNDSDNKHVRFSLDALNYREKRIETLKRLAFKMADKAMANNKRVSLEPMSSAERRIIHAALSENDNITTRSEGHEPNRRVVILPVRK